MTDINQTLKDLGALPPAQLRALWRDCWRRPAPDIGPDLLRRDIAWKLQSRVHGDLPRHVRREIDAAIKRLRHGEAVAPPRFALRPGARLVRSWRGQTYQVVVLEQGFEFDGRHFKSLTQIARAITGTHQSGLLFFGIKPRLPVSRSATSTSHAATSR